MLIGVVGKPNTGKSTFFKALTLADVEIANYPFATIKPNHGVGFVQVKCVDKEFQVQCNPREGYCKAGWRFVPVDLLDVAGLVPGAHLGKGMGNQFLDDLNQADALIHIIDVSGSTNEKGEPINPLSYDPAEDIRFLETELDYWYLRLITKGWNEFARRVQQEHSEVHKALTKHLTSFRVSEALMQESMKRLDLPSMITAWKDEDLLRLAHELRVKTKPMIIACNKIDVPGAEKNMQRLVKQFPHYPLIPCSAESELALKEAARHQLIEYIPGGASFAVTGKLSENQRTALEFIQGSILDRQGSAGVQQVLNAAVFELLRYIAVFPGGVGKLQDQEGRFIPDCFLMPQGATALDFAFRIHTDLGKKFIRGIDVRTRRVIGKEYQLRHRDVIEIVTQR